MDDKLYEIMGTQSITLIDSMGIPVDGVKIHFKFGDGFEGDVKLSNADLHAGKAKEQITAYIKAIVDLM